MNDRALPRFLALPLVAAAAMLVGCEADTTGTTNATSSSASGTGGSMSSSTGATMTTSSSGTGGTGGGTPVGCIPTEGMAIPATCGAFVRQGGTGDGSQAAPAGLFSTVTAGTVPDRIYVCGNASNTIVESVVLPGGVSVYGGFDCQSWVYSAASTKPKIFSDANLPALVIAGPGESTLFNIDFIGSDANGPANSSIGILASEVKLTIENVSVTAGSGSTGASGMSASPNNAAAGVDGLAGQNACGAGATAMGGAQVDQTCNGAIVSSGGKGGSAEVGKGNNGSPGITGTAGQAGAGQPQNGQWSCVVSATGGGGAKGSAGAPGPNGAAGTDKGSLTIAGFVAAFAGDGGPGAPGQGGGGGGGSKGSSSCGIGVTGPGAGGGSGAAGGCGGFAGKGGQGGGASFALVSLGATVTLKNSSMKAGSGGLGGNGGSSQPGAVGGTGGNGGNGTVVGPSAGCAGGDGGFGGKGGGGGGGRGGHSAAIAFTGTPPTVDGTSMILSGAAGEGGSGQGNGADAAQDGVDGGKCAIMNFEGATEMCTVQ